MSVNMSNLRGCRRVFVNGCFDVIHIGHVRLLRYAAQFGRVVVAINSDSSVRHLKGPGRPIFTASDRIEMLSALSCVDFVLVFDESTPMTLLQKMFADGVGPHFIVKGSEYEKRDFPERALSAKILFYPTVRDMSTTRILRCLQF